MRSIFAMKSLFTVLVGLAALTSNFGADARVNPHNLTPSPLSLEVRDIHKIDLLKRAGK